MIFFLKKDSNKKIFNHIFSSYESLIDDLT